MPNTSTASHPALVAGRVARASDVEARFDWSEHNLWPHSSGTKADNAYSLGDTDSSWANLYVHQINPTGPVQLVIGSTTAANSDTGLEVSLQRAFVFPRVTQATKDGWSGVNGMACYDSTLEKFQIYENGGWVSLGAPIQQVLHTLTSASITTANTATHTGATLNITIASVTVAKAFVLPTGPYLETPAEGVNQNRFKLHMSARLTSSTNVEVQYHFANEMGSTAANTVYLPVTVVEYT